MKRSGQKTIRQAAAALCAAAFFLGAAGISSAAQLAPPPQVSAKSAALLDGTTGECLYVKNGEQRALIASTTKIMTGLLVCEAGELDRTVTVPDAAVGLEGSSMYLKKDETLTRRDLLYGMMLVSGNDAAVALACHTAGSVQAFADMMNDKVRALGMTGSAFQNPNGLDAEGHYSTARDMAKLACAAMENETFRTIVSTKSTTVDGQTLVNHNRLLRSYDGAVGVKTGYTKTAGRTLVSCAQRGATRFVCVTLSDPDDWNDHTRLLDWAFENYEYRCVAGDTPVYAVPVLSATVELCAAAPERPAYLLVHPDDPVSLKAELPRFTFAPVEQGAQAGTLTATGPDGQSVTVPLRYAEPAALDPDVKITPLARLGRLWTHACRYFSSYYYPVS